MENEEFLNLIKETKPALIEAEDKYPEDGFFIVFENGIKVEVGMSTDPGEGCLKFTEVVLPQDEFVDNYSVDGEGLETLRVLVGATDEITRKPISKEEIDNYNKYNKSVFERTGKNLQWQRPIK